MTTPFWACNKDYPAGAIANSVLHRMVERDVVKPDRVISSANPKPFPTTDFGTVYNLTPIAGRIKRAFFDFN